MAKKRVKANARKDQPQDSSSDEGGDGNIQESPLAKKSKQPARVLVPPASPSKAKGRAPPPVPAQMPAPARVTRAKKAAGPAPTIDALVLPMPKANTRANARARAAGPEDDEGQPALAATPARGGRAARGGAPARARGGTRAAQPQDRPAPEQAQDDEHDEPVPELPQPARGRPKRGRGAARRIPSSPAHDDAALEEGPAEEEEERAPPQPRRRIVRGRDLARLASPPPRARSHSPMAVSPVHDAAARRRGGRSDRFSRPVVSFDDDDADMQYASADEAHARGMSRFHPGPALCAATHAIVFRLSPLPASCAMRRAPSRAMR